MFQTIDLFILHTGLTAFCLSLRPYFFRYDSFVDSVINREIVLLNGVELVPGAVDLFVFSSAVGELPAVNRIIQYDFYEMSRECIQRTILPFHIVSVEQLKY